MSNDGRRQDLFYYDLAIDNTTFRRNHYKLPPRTVLLHTIDAFYTALPICGEGEGLSVKIAAHHAKRTPSSSQARLKLRRPRRECLNRCAQLLASRD